MKKIVVIDGQGGGIGRALVEKIREAGPKQIELLAVGTNAMATAQMLKAGADAGASGESAVIFNCRHADLIVGPVGILTAGSMLGELSPAMANAIGESCAQKIVVPLNKCHIQVAGVPDVNLPVRISQAVELVMGWLLAEEQ